MLILLDGLVSWFASVDLPAAIQGGAAVWVAGVSTLALRTWRTQLRAQKYIEFTEAITNAAHEYILLMRDPVSHLEMARIAINSNQPFDTAESSMPQRQALVRFIEREGMERSQLIWASLAEVKPVLSRLQSLSIKGQALGIASYDRCMNACRMLEWSYNQIEAFCAVIRSPYMNWDHPEVQKNLNVVASIEPSALRSNLAAQNIEIIAFAQNVYKKAFR